jgi:hypothetical protein
MRLNTVDAKATVTNAWGGSPNNNTFNVYQSGSHNTSGNDYIAYCWHSVEGYSKFGHAFAEPSTDGAYVHCGFRPSFVLWRNLNGSRGWFIVDSARSPYNPVQLTIDAQDAPGENGYGYGELMDFTASGFKLRNTSTPNFAEAGDGFIFAAFAEQPFSGPSNAR